MTLTEMARQIEKASPTPLGEALAQSRAFTDRSNCRKAMLKFAASNSLAPDALHIVKHGDKDFRFERIATVPAEDGIPASLKIPPEQRAAAWDANPPKAPAPASTKETADMARKTSTTTKAPARKPVTAKTSAPKAGARNRYDWAAAEEMADKGKMPPALDFSAPTHARFRDALAEVVKAAKAKDEKALRSVKINPVSSSPKALDRYRGLCLKAVKAKGSAAA